MSYVRAIRPTEGTREELAGFLGMGLLFVVAETFVFSQRGEIGLAIHGVAAAISLYFVHRYEGDLEKLYQSLLLVPVLRIFNLGLPLFTENSLLLLFVLYSFLLVSVLMIVRSQDLTPGTLGIDPKGLPMTVPAALVGIVLGIVQYRLDLEQIAAPFTPVNVVLIVLTTGVLIGLVEETIFRGLIQRWADARFDTWLAIGVTSLIFGFMHSVWFTSLDIVFAFLVSLLLGYAYVRTNNLWLIASVHGSINVSAFLLAPLFLPGLGG